MNDKVLKEIETWIEDDGKNATDHDCCFMICRTIAYCTDVIVNAINEQIKESETLRDVSASRL